jgi:small subunit ribosomal protein S17
MIQRNIGIQVQKPKRKCEDDSCPFHGTLKCRGRIFTGTIISSKMQKTVTVEWKWKRHLKKYERYEKSKTKVKAHNPTCIGASDGDVVKIMECRPLSKTKNFIIVELLGKEKGFKERIEALEESKVKKELIKEGEKSEETPKELG